MSSSTALVLTNGLPQTTTISGTSITGNYWSGYVAAGNTWTATGGTATNMTHGSGTATLTTLLSNGITVSAAGSSAAGITFTPASSSAIYRIVAVFSDQSDGQFHAYNLSDGSGTFGFSNPVALSAGQIHSMVCDGIYAPGASSPVTVQIQAAATGGGTAMLG